MDGGRLLFKNFIAFPSQQEVACVRSAEKAPPPTHCHNQNTSRVFSKHSRVKKSRSRFCVKKLMSGAQNAGGKSIAGAGAKKMGLPWNKAVKSKFGRRPDTGTKRCAPREKISHANAALVFLLWVVIVGGNWASGGRHASYTVRHITTTYLFPWYKEFIEIIATG